MPKSTSIIAVLYKKISYTMPAVSKVLAALIRTYADVNENTLCIRKATDWLAKV